jgi:hypothetical protein
MKTKLCFVLCIGLMSWPIAGFTQTWVSFSSDFCQFVIYDKLYKAIFATITKKSDGKLRA